jgi:hypothetical protein
MQAKFIYESIKHLKPRTEEEIETAERAAIEEHLSFIKELDVKEDIIQLKLALKKVKIKMWIHLGEKSKDYEIRLSDEPIQSAVVISHDDMPYRGVNIYYITEKTIEINYSHFVSIGRPDITPCFAVSNWSGKALLHTKDWHELYQYILEKKNEYLDTLIAEYADAIEKIKKSKINT